jgi:hypothetical protein
MRQLTSTSRLPRRWCSRLSFVTLKLSRSITSTATTLPSRSAQPNACSRRSRNRERFGRSGRGSCRAATRLCTISALEAVGKLVRDDGHDQEYQQR